MRKYLPAALLGALAGAMLVFPGEAMEAAKGGLSLWAFSVVPVLGPFMVCMLLFGSRIPGGRGIRLLLSWLCGSPGGAKLMSMLRPGKKQALRDAAMTGTMSPMFFLGTVSAWLGSPGAGKRILIAHWLGAFLTGLMLPGEGKTEKISPAPLPLSQALKESALALLSVALCMMLGCVSAGMARCVFPGLSPAFSTLFQCLLEVTAGVKAITEMKIPCREALAAATCSFGGLSLLLQNAAVWQERGVGPGKLLPVRLLHGGIAFLVCRILSYII